MKMHGFVLTCPTIQRHRSTPMNGRAITSLSLSFPPLTAGPELSRCFWVAGRGCVEVGRRIPLLISQVCSVLISALVSSSYSVSSV